MPLVSVLIPARNELFLNRTIQEVFDKAAGDVECIVYLDGERPVEPVLSHSNLTIIEGKQPKGIAVASWESAQVARGEFVMKLDAHCALAQGYDVIMQEACGENDLCVPARYQLKPERWITGYGPIHFLYLTYPWIYEAQFGVGLHGKKWLGADGLEGGYFHLEQERDSIRVDDIMAYQGSCWFMRRQRFLDLGGVDPRYWLWQESTDMCFKVWLSGGRCLRVKDAWYAHLHKGQRFGRGYYINKLRAIEGNYYSADFWMNDRWEHPLKVRSTSWFVKHFWPIPGWPEDWDNPHYQSVCESTDRPQDVKPLGSNPRS